MKIKIGFKIVFLGVILSLLVTIIGTLASYFIYVQRSVDDYENGIVEVLDNLDSDIETDPDLSEIIKNLKTKIDGIYQEDPDDPEFESFSEKEEYYHNKYPFLYTRPGYFGLSLDDLKLKNGFLSVQTKLLDANIFARVRSVYIAYHDDARGRIVYLADSRHGENNTEYYLPGSYYVMTSDDYQYEKTESINFYNIHGIETLYKELTIKDEDDNVINVGSVFIEYDEGNIKTSAKIFLRYILIILILSALIITILYAIMSRYLITRNISKLNDSTKLFTNKLMGSSDKNELQPIDAKVRSKDEIGELSNNINSMENEILAYIKRIEEAGKVEQTINAELHVASKIQLDSLPQNGLENDKIRIDSFIQSAKEVGGDFYDYFYLDKNRIALIISDVSGKGVPAALFMMKSKELIKSKLLSGMALDKVFYDINNELLLNNDEGLFITSLVMVINLKTLECNIINAGHERPFLVRNGKAIRMNIESNFILGGVNDFKYITETVKLEQGDKLLLHTDGLNESINDLREEFGYDRIIEVLDNSKDSNDYIDNLNRALKEFTQDKEQFDDVTMLSVNLKTNELIVCCDTPSVDSITEITDKFNDHFKNLDSMIKNKVSIIIDDVINNYVSYEDLNTLKIKVVFKEYDHKLFIDFINNGIPFNPLDVKNGKYEEYSEDMVPGGLGILIVKEMTDDIKYQRIDNLNILSMRFDLDKDENN